MTGFSVKETGCEKERGELGECELRAGGGEGGVRIAEKHLRMRWSHSISSPKLDPSCGLSCRHLRHEKKRDIVRLGIRSDRLCDEPRSPFS